MTSEFDKYAPTYPELLSDPIRESFAGSRDFFHFRKSILIRDFFTNLGVSTNSLSWLDVGCGQGELLKRAGDQFGRAVGCDPSSRMIQGAGSAEIVVQSSSTELPFPDKSFDFVTAVCVYHHVRTAERESLTRSIQRVLKPGGVFCMIEHNPWNPLTQIIVRRCPVDVDAQLLTAPAASRLMRSSGLEIIKATYFLYVPEPVFKRIGRIEKYLELLPLGGQFAMFSQKSG